MFFLLGWYHFDCFFDRQRPKSAGDIEHFDQLRWEDQQKINKKIESIKIRFAWFWISKFYNL